MSAGLRLLAALGALLFPSFGAAQAQPGAAQRAVAARAMDRRFEAAFEAAGRGDLGPVERALASERRAELRTLLRAQLAAARFAAGVHRDPELARIATRARDPGLRETALNIITAAAFAEGDYAAAAAAGARLVAMPGAGRDPEELASAEQTRQLAALLARHPAQRVEGAVARAAVTLRHDAVGLPRIEVAIGGSVQEAVVDSGANLSVLSAGAARRLGVTIVETDATVGNGVQGDVPVRLGIADRLDIAGTTIRNAAFLIIEDAQLSFPVAGGYRIEAILGLPVLRALQRVLLAADRLTVEAPQPFDARRQNLFADANDLFVRARIGGRDVPLHLDTGANQTSLTALFAAAHPALVAGLATGEQRTASAGGARRDEAAVWSGVVLEVAGRTAVLPTVTIALPGEGSASVYGTIGSNALRRFAGHTIDFRAMRLELGEPVAAAGTSR